MRVRVPADAGPRSGGTIRIRQVDALSDVPTGGIQYSVYEDHLPPVAVDDLRSELVGNDVVLSWAPVATESGSGGPEDVACYEVFRDGVKVAFYVEQHNSVIPHHAFKGHTPDEVYFGRGDEVPNQLAEARADARARRMEANRARRCAVCA